MRFFFYFQATDTRKTYTYIYIYVSLEIDEMTGKERLFLRDRRCRYVTITEIELQ